MVEPPADYFSAIAQLIPLLVITSVVEAHALRPTNAEGEDDDPPEDFDVIVLLAALVGEMAAIAGLAGQPTSFEAFLATFGLSLTGATLLAQIGTRLAWARPPGRSRRKAKITGIVVAITPLAWGTVWGFLHFMT